MGKGDVAALLLNKLKEVKKLLAVSDKSAAIETIRRMHVTVISDPQVPEDSAIVEMNPQDLEVMQEEQKLREALRTQMEILATEEDGERFVRRASSVIEMASNLPAGGPTTTIANEEKEERLSKLELEHKYLDERIEEEVAEIMKTMHSMTVTEKNP